MSLHILHSNRVERLMAHLARSIREAPAGLGPLEHEKILLDNPVMGSWINLQLALEHDIAANIDYVTLTQFFWDVSREVVSADIPRETPFNKQELTWRLLGLLQQEMILEEPDLLPVKKYLGVEDETDRFTELKKYQLAARVADLFDQYLVFRPDWINGAWDHGHNLAGDRMGEPWKRAERWQKALWVKLAQGAGDSALRHRAAIHRRLCSRLESGPCELPFKRLFVFGVTSMAPAQIDMLMGLARHAEVYLYLLNPCGFEWFDIRSEKAISRLKRRKETQSSEIVIGNPLLAAQGGQVRDFLNLVFSKMDQYLEDAAIVDDLDFEDPDPGYENSLLACVQQDILELGYRGDVAQYDKETGAARKLPDAEMICPSIHVHNCHSPLREVEVLHDQLLDLFDRDPGLAPRDVVVMMPRVGPYLPYIRSVFESRTGRAEIPIQITDLSWLEETPLLNSFGSLLEIPESRLPLSEVLGLLDVPAVQRRFGLDADSYDTLRKWLIESGARWGLDAEHRKAEADAGYSEFSWEFGLNRMWAGYAMGAADGCTPLEVSPLDEIEGGNANVFNAFIEFWLALKQTRRDLRGAHSPARWREILRRMLDQFYAPEGDEWRAFNVLSRGIDELGAVENTGWFAGAIPLQVVRATIKPVLEQASERRHPWSEGVKFCSLLPMRGVPFKVIYLLGMNMEDYPRQIDAPGFDLMRENVRPGDRSARMDDRWLFLEALVSARNRFYVSYVGQDMFRNEAREPSVVVSELIDYLRDGYGCEPNSADTDGYSWPPGWFEDGQPAANSLLHTRHPLQPYSPQYFTDRSGPPRLFSCNPEAWLLSQGQHAARRDERKAPGRWRASRPTEGESLEVLLDDFSRFFAKPEQWFLASRNASLGRYDDQARDEETWTLEPGLEQWQQLDGLLAWVRRNDPAPLDDDGNARLQRAIGRYVATQKARGAWPLGANGEKESARLAKLDPAYVFFSNSTDSARQPVSLQLAVRVGEGGEAVNATLDLEGGADLHNGALRYHSASKAAHKYLLDYYIRVAATALAALETDPAMPLAEAQAAFKETPRDMKDWPQAFAPTFLAQADAHRDFLSGLAGLYLEWHDNGLPFHPELSRAIHDDPAMTEALEEKAEKTWFGDGYYSRGAVEDNAQRAYFGQPSVFMEDAFLSCSRQVWSLVDNWRNAASAEEVS